MMKLLTQLTNVRNIFKNAAIALGTFDGVHIGHQEIISKAVDLANEADGTSVVFTFSNHPLSVIDPDRCPLQLITPDYKAELISALGIDLLITIPFTPQFLRLSAEEFINSLLLNIAPKHIVVGPNYSFGFQSKGNPSLLEQAGAKYNFSVHIHEGVYWKNQIVSSTFIRQLILDGKVDAAIPLLGRPVKLTGKVIHGDKRGRTLGFPTINLDTPPGLVIPNDGVYAVKIDIKGSSFNGVANIGFRPTFNGTSRNIEIYILDFNQMIYGEAITVEFIQRIRGEISFNSMDDLKQQIQSDIHKTMELLKN